MRCPACGATNPEGAQWCGQCLHRFGQSPSVAGNGAPPPGAATPAAPLPATSAPSAATPATAQPTEATEGFRRQGDTLEWACPSCEQFNSMDDVHCVVCGTAFSERFR